MKTIKKTLVAMMVAWAGHAAADDNASLVDRGKLVFDHWCGTCHGKGERKAGTASLAVKYRGSIPAALEERNDLSLDFLRNFVRHGALIMPPFRKTEVTDADLDAIAAYLTQSKK